MTIKTGIDSVSIARIKRSMESPGFLRKIYSPIEIEYMSGKKNPSPTAAGHFAAKEAFLKAMGTGITTTALWEIGVDHDELGAPFLALTGWAAELGAGFSFSLSITHTEDTATAIVVAYREA